MWNNWRTERSYNISGTDTVQMDFIGPWVEFIYSLLMGLATIQEEFVGEDIEQRRILMRCRGIDDSVWRVCLSKITVCPQVCDFMASLTKSPLELICLHQFIIFLSFFHVNCQLQPECHILRETLFLYLINHQSITPLFFFFHRCFPYQMEFPR